MDIRKNLENIHKLSNLVIQQLGPQSNIANFGLNEASVVWIDGFIERQREAKDFSSSEVDGLVNTLGSFLGEALVVTAGGTWVWVEQQQTIGVELRGSYVFPFNKVRKQLVNGRAAGDSIAGFFRSILSLQAVGKL
jgi:hypothetical protein